MVTIEWDEARGVDCEGDISYHVTYEPIDSYVERTDFHTHTFMFLSSHLIARCLHASNVRYAAQRDRVPEESHSARGAVCVFRGIRRHMDVWIDVHGGLVW